MKAILLLSINTHKSCVTNYIQSCYFCYQNKINDYNFHLKLDSPHVICYIKVMVFQETIDK